MSNKIEKSTVINKNSIARKLNHYYITLAEANGISKKQAKNSIIRVEKLSAYVSDYCFSFDDIYHDSVDDEYIEIEYYANSQMAMWIDGIIDARFNIMPSTAHVTFEVDGLMLDWIPNKPLYVTSFDEYLNLYKSFIAYLEDYSRYPYGHGHLIGEESNDLENAEFKICCSNLYSNFDVIETELPAERAIPLFTEDNFKSSKLTIITHEGYFISVNEHPYERRIIPIHLANKVKK